MQWPPPAESKRLGLCQKSLFAVPEPPDLNNGPRVFTALSFGEHSRHQEKDFEGPNRKKFCAKIATGDMMARGDYGTSQFERLPMSFERRRGAAVVGSVYGESEAALEELKKQPRGEVFRQTVRTENAPWRPDWKNSKRLDAQGKD